MSHLKEAALLTVFAFVLSAGVAHAQHEMMHHDAATETGTPADISKTFSRTLHQGASGEDVVMLQEILRDHGLFAETSTGYFGQITSKGVASFQVMYHLEPVGYVGPQTLNLLNTVHERMMDVSAVPRSTDASVESSDKESFLQRIQRIAKSLVAAASGRPKVLAVTFRANAETVTLGTNVKLMWKSNADTCTASGAWDGILDAMGNKNVIPVVTDTYTITCTRGIESISKSLTVTVTSATVTPAPTVLLSAEPLSATSGGSATITWSSANATSCTASGSWGGAQPISGSQVFTNLTNNQTYTLTCSGAGGSTSTSTSVTVTPAPVVPAPTLALTSDVTTIQSGGSATVTWSSTNTTSCTASGSWNGTQSTTGVKTATNLTADQTYTLMCTGAGGTVSKTVAILVTAPTNEVLGVTSGLDSIPSNFDINAELGPAWGTGEIPPPEHVVGAFRFVCNPSHEAYDDPIVYPGQPGKSHLHQFFGNTMTNAYSTYQSLRTTGASTCNSPVNRSAYWIPAMMNGKGKVVRPDYVSIYYKRRPATDPIVSDPTNPQYQGKGVDLPRGLRYIFGYNMTTNSSPGSGWAGPIWFNCDGPTAKSDRYPDIATAAANCPAGNKLLAVIVAPDCWDGKNLDSANHRDHMAYGSYGSWGYYKCPDTHPYVIPQFQLGAAYTVDDDLDRSGTWDGSKPTWHLSSDVMSNGTMLKPGTTLHADWFGAWDDTVLRMWHDHCINKQLSCSGGNLGNGLQMKMFSGFTWEANPRIVDPPGTSAAKPVVVGEGDSISIFWAGNYTGIYAAAHPNVEYHGLAVGGSGVNTLDSRVQAVTAYHPKFVSILIGANDLAYTSGYPTTQDWLNALWSYVAEIKATGAKVAVGTVLPQYQILSFYPGYNEIFAARRVEANNAIRAAVGTKIDAVIDYAADPVMGPDSAARDTALYYDGVHPTDGAGGQGKLSVVYTKAMDALIASGLVTR